MQITGIHSLTDPFIGHGSLVINGQATDNIRGRSLKLIVEQLNSLSTGVVASVDVGGFLTLTSETNFTIAGNQDVLDTIGITATG